MLTRQRSRLARTHTRRPFQDSFASALGYAAQIVIFVVFGTAVAIEGGAGVNYWHSFLLCVATLGLIAAAAVVSLQRHLRKQRLARWKREQMVQKIEWACNFLATKFRTTFDKVIETAIPPSHALVFVYGSIGQVKRMLRSGISISHENASREDGREVSGCISKGVRK